MTAQRHRAKPAARATPERFYRWADGVDEAELSRLARTVRAWEAEILAWHVTGGSSNGPTEAVNLLIKKVKRLGHSLRDFANYRLRLLLQCRVAWQTHRTARLRGPLTTFGGVEPPKLFGALAMVASLDLGVCEELRTLIEDLYGLEGRITIALRRIDTDHAAAVQAVAESLPAVNKLLTTVPPELARIMRMAEAAQLG